MKIFILAGGVGTRLWPLSHAERPKYLLQIEKDNSLLQQTFMRACLLTQLDNIFIITQKNVVEKIKSNIPLLNFKNIIVEPCLGGTSNCLLLAVLHCMRNKCSEKEVIAFMHADHVIGDEKQFIYSFKMAEKKALNSKKIILIGINPTFPSTEFGYIQCSGDNFVSFIEKPNIETAKKFINLKNYLWNAGYFIGKISTFLHEIKSVNLKLYHQWLSLLKLSNSEINNVYCKFPNEALDYSLLERTKNISVIKGCFRWNDIGTFETLSALGKINNSVGKNTHEIESNDNYVWNDANTPIVIIDCKNLIVVNTNRGILISTSKKSKLVSIYSKNVK